MHNQLGNADVCGRTSPARSRKISCVNKVLAVQSKKLKTHRRIEPVSFRCVRVEHNLN